MLNILVLTGTAFYSWLFFRAGAGINALVFSTFAVGGILALHREYLDNHYALLAAGGTQLSALMIVWHHSVLASVVHILSFLLLIGYVQQRTLRFIFFAGMLALGSLLMVPFTAFRRFAMTGKRKAFWRWVKLSILPLLIGGIFFTIYYQANEAFASLFAGFVTWLESWNWIDWPPERTGTLVVGFLLCGALFWSSGLGPYLLNFDRMLSSQLHRQKAGERTSLLPGIPWRPAFSILSLKQEYWAAMLTLAVLNGLLLLLNLLDLRYVWLDFSEKSPQQLSDYVHQGTWLLLFSIALAMLVILWFFRRNLNFYPGNRPLRQLAVAWLIQNAVLASSVGLRNFHYILYYGLAYKRLVVMVFLILVLTGLWTMYRKVRVHKTIYYLLQRNGWAIYLTLLIMSCLNWDLIITRYNLFIPARNGIDTGFLIEEVSDKNLYLLEAYRDRLKAPANPHSSAYDIDQRLKNKRNRFTERVKNQDWRGWNVADWRNRKQ